MDTAVISPDGYTLPRTDFSLFNAQTTPVSSLYTFTYPYSPGAMAGSSDDYDYLLLFYALPSTSLIFFDGTKCVSVTMIKDVVYDICWSRSTKVFLVTTIHYLYEFNPLNSVLSKPYEFSQSPQSLWTITCDSTDLFIVYAPNMSMHKRNVKQPFAKKRAWTANEVLCEQDDQVIGSVRIDEQHRICKLSFYLLNQMKDLSLLYSSSSNDQTS